MAFGIFKKSYMLSYSNKGTTFFCRGEVTLPHVGEVDVYCSRYHNKALYELRPRRPYILITPISTYTNIMDWKMVTREVVMSKLRVVKWEFLDSDFPALMVDKEYHLDFSMGPYHLFSHTSWPWTNTRRMNIVLTSTSNYTKSMMSMSVIGTPTDEEIVGFWRINIMITMEGRVICSSKLNNTTLIMKKSNEKGLFDSYKEVPMNQTDEFDDMIFPHESDLYWYNRKKGGVMEKEEKFDFNRTRALFGCNLNSSLSKLQRRRRNETDITMIERDIAKGLIEDPKSVTQTNLTIGIVSSVLKRTHDIMLAETGRVLGIKGDIGDILIGSLLSEAEKKLMSDYSTAKTPDIVVEVNDIPNEIWMKIKECAILRGQGEAEDAEVLISDVFVSRDFRSAEMEKIAKYTRVAKELTQIKNRVHIFLPLGFDMRSGDVWFFQEDQEAKNVWNEVRQVRNVLENDPNFLKLQSQMNDTADKIKMTSEDFSMILGEFEPKGFSDVYSKEALVDLEKSISGKNNKRMKDKVNNLKKVMEEIYKNIKDGIYDNMDDSKESNMIKKVMSGMKEQEVRDSIASTEYFMNKDGVYSDKPILKLVSPPTSEDSDYFTDILHKNLKEKLKLKKFYDNKTKVPVEMVYRSNDISSKKRKNTNEMSKTFMCNVKTAMVVDEIMKILSMTRKFRGTSYKRFKDIMINARLDSQKDDFKEFYSSMTNTNMGHFMAFYEEVMMEVAHNVKRRYTSKGSTTIFRMTSWGAFSISKGAQFTREKQIMVKFYFSNKCMMAETNLGQVMEEPTMEKPWYESKWLALNYSDFEHFSRIYDRYTLLMTHLTADRMESTKSDSFLETFNQFKEEFMLPSLVLLEHKRNTSTSLQMNRYIIHSSLSLFSDRAGLIDKMKEVPIRSMVQSYIIYRQMRYMENYFTSGTNEMSDMIIEMKTSFKETSYYSVTIPTIFGENEKAEMRYIINEMYYCNLFNKEEGFQTHRSKPVMEKMAEDEINFRTLKDFGEKALEGEASMDLYFTKRMYHLFDRDLVMASGALLSRAFFDSINWENVTKEVCKSISSLCTLKSSVYSSPVEMGTGLEVTEEGLKVKALPFITDNNIKSVRATKVSDIRKRELKIHNRRMEKLEDDGMTLEDYNKVVSNTKLEKREKTYSTIRKYHVDDMKASTVLEAANSYNLFNIYMGTFPKSQIGGPREIMIQDAVSRVRIAVLEVISAEMCKVIPMEMISKGEKKKEDLMRAKDELYSAYSGKGLDNNIMLYNNTDQSHWGPSINLLQFGYFISGMEICDKLKRWMINCTSAFCMKQVALPINLQTNWMFSTHTERSESLEWLKEEYKKNNWVMTFHSGMGQGMLNYLSSLYHSGSAYLASNMLIEVVKDTQNNIIFKERFLLSSDDKTELKLVFYDNSQSLLEFILADLMVKELVDTGMNIHKNNKKSGYGCILGEFNSQFTLGNRVLCTAIKDIYTSMDIPDMTLPEDAVRQLLSYEKRLLESGVTLMTSTIARLNNWYFLIRCYKYDIKLISDIRTVLECELEEIPFTLGFMPLTNIYETCILGPDYIVSNYDKKSKMKKHYKAIYGAVKSEKTAVLRNSFMQDGSLMGKMVISLPVRRDSLFRNMMKKWKVTIEDVKEKMEDNFWLLFHESNNMKELEIKLDNYLTQTGMVYNIRDQVRVDSMIRAMGMAKGNAVVIGASIKDRDNKIKSFNSKMDVMGFLNFTLRPDIPRAKMKEIPNMKLFKSLNNYIQKSEGMKVTYKRMKKTSNKETLRRLTMTPLSMTVMDNTKKMFDMLTTGLAKFSNWARESIEMFKSYTGLVGNDFDELVENLKDKSSYPKTFLCNLMRNFVKMYSINNMYMVTDFTDKGNMMQNIVMMYLNREEPNYYFEDDRLPAVLYSQKRHNVMKATMLVSEDLNKFRKTSEMVLGKPKHLKTKISKSMKNELKNYLILNYLMESESSVDMMKRVMDREWYSENKSWNKLTQNMSSFIFYKGIILEIEKFREMNYVLLRFYMIKDMYMDYNWEEITGFLQLMSEYARKEIVGFMPYQLDPTPNCTTVQIGGINYYVSQFPDVNYSNIMFRATSKDMEVSITFSNDSDNKVKFQLLKDNSIILMDKEVDFKKAGNMEVPLKTLMYPKGVSEEDMFNTMSVIDKNVGYKQIEDNFYKLYDKRMDFQTYAAYTRNLRTTDQEDDNEVVMMCAEEAKDNLRQARLPISMDSYKMNVWSTVLSDYEKTFKTSTVLDITDGIDDKGMTTTPFSFFTDIGSFKASSKGSKGNLKDQENMEVEGGINIDFSRLTEMKGMPELKMLDNPNWADMSDEDSSFHQEGDEYRRSNTSAGPSTFGKIDFSKLADIGNDIQDALTGMNFMSDSDKRGSTIEVLRRNLLLRMSRKYRFESLAVRENFENYFDMLKSNNNIDDDTAKRVAADAIFGNLMCTLASVTASHRVKMAARLGKKKPKEVMDAVFSFLVFSVAIKDLFEFEMQLKVQNLLLFPISTDAEFYMRAMVTKRH